MATKNARLSYWDKNSAYEDAQDRLDRAIISGHKAPDLEYERNNYYSV